MPFTGEPPRLQPSNSHIPAADAPGRALTSSVLRGRDVQLVGAVLSSPVTQGWASELIRPVRGGGCNEQSRHTVLCRVRRAFCSSGGESIAHVWRVCRVNRLRYYELAMTNGFDGPSAGSKASCGASTGLLTGDAGHSMLNSPVETSPHALGKPLSFVAAVQNLRLDGQGGLRARNRT